MSDLTPSSPEVELAEADPGDETAKRYRFQYTWAAIMCCALLDDTRDIKEIFCEHHEDVLIKHADGSFTGQQVKTRGAEQPVWKAGDSAVVKSMSRFAKLDVAYPGCFRSFQFLTNHPVHAAESSTGLAYVLRSVEQATTPSTLPTPVRSWLKKVVNDSGLSEGQVFQALRKAQANAELPKLNDSVMRLIDTLSQLWVAAEECSHLKLREAAIALVDECARASSLEHSQSLVGYMLPGMNSDLDVVQIVEGKRIDQEKVEVLLDSVNEGQAILSGDPSDLVEPGGGSPELLHKKLDAGGFSAVSRNSADDLRLLAEYLGVQWTKKLGREKGLSRYEHLKNIAMTDAGRAFDASENSGDNFGPDMREDFRVRIQQRRNEGEEFFGASNDHVEGVAFSLTAACKVTWSHARPWESD